MKVLFYILVLLGLLFLSSTNILVAVAGVIMLFAAAMISQIYDLDV